MKKTGLLFDERFLLHKTEPGHPECPERLTRIYRALQQNGVLSKLVPVPATPADMQWIQKVHSPSYISRFQAACSQDLGEFESPDNQISPETFETAVLAVGGVLNSIDMLMEGRIDNAFCAVRPPGHHAESDRALGFCYFNNIAVAAVYMQKVYKIEKIGIIDFDVHHGNGTQAIFERDGGVFYYSIHEHPSFAYPGTGRDFEKGSGPGHGMTLNSTLLPGEADEDYKLRFDLELFPAFERFKPDVILVSAGFDAHVLDDMSEIRLSTEGFSWIAQKVVELADRYSKGRLISVLEGGYCLDVLPELVRNHIHILLGE